jgi:hypothetical protein
LKLNGKDTEMPTGVRSKPITVQDIGKKCHPLLAQCIVHAGGVQPLADAAHMGSNNLRLIRDGERPLTERVRAKLAAYANQHKLEIETASVTAVVADQARAPQPALPALVPWDGKSFVAVEVQAKMGEKPKKFKKCPAPLAEALNAVGGSRLKLAKALGFTHATPISDVLNGVKSFDVKMQTKLHRLRHGLSPSTDEPAAQDDFKLGIAICLTALNTYERLEEIAEVLQGARIVRRGTGTAGWLVIWRFPTNEKTMTFKRLAHRDAKEIICP